MSTVGDPVSKGNLSAAKAKKSVEGSAAFAAKDIQSNALDKASAVAGNLSATTPTTTPTNNSTGFQWLTELTPSTFEPRGQFFTIKESPATITRESNHTATKPKDLPSTHLNQPLLDSIPAIFAKYFHSGQFNLFNEQGVRNSLITSYPKTDPLLLKAESLLKETFGNENKMILVHFKALECNPSDFKTGSSGPTPAPHHDKRHTIVLSVAKDRSDQICGTVYYDKNQNVVYQAQSGEMTLHKQDDCLHGSPSSIDPRHQVVDRYFIAFAFKQPCYF